MLGACLAGMYLECRVAHVPHCDCSSYQADAIIWVLSIIYTGAHTYIIETLTRVVDSHSTPSHTESRQYTSCVQGL